MLYGMSTVMSHAQLQDLTAMRAVQHLHLWRSTILEKAPQASVK